jgi:hypothetical protein
MSIHFFLDDNENDDESGEEIDQEGKKRMKNKKEKMKCYPQRSILRRNV